MFSLSSSSINTLFHENRITERTPSATSCSFYKPHFQAVAQSSKSVNKLGALPSSSQTVAVHHNPSIIETENNTKKVDPKFVLTGNFAPVDEMPPTQCLVIQGELPQSLNGAYIRNGPNPQHQPLGPHHLFEGDGMLHSIRLSGGQAIFCSRYVKTYKYNLERKAGVPLIPNFLSGFYGLTDLFRGTIIILARAINGQINLAEGFGVANTSLAFFFDSLFAMVETDLPYAIRVTQEGDIETIGRYNFAGQVFANMTAHPKIDAKTGELFAFRCFPVFPYLTFFRFDTNGLKEQDVPIFSMKGPTYVHDFAITERYAVFPDTQLEMDTMNMLTCKGMPLRSQSAKMPRIGIIPRCATSDSEMRWFEVPGFNGFHIINVWEEEDDSIIIIAPNVLISENLFQSMDKLHFSLEKLRIDMKTGMASRTILSKTSLELGSINAAYAGKKNRFAYMAMGEHIPKMSGVVKIDLELECEVSKRTYEDGCFGGEAFFVARDAGDPDCDEDDGYVVSYVHNEITKESRFVVMDAKSPTLEIVAAVKLPGRVPYGFHGLFVSENDLKKL
ncbi:hypothetical protein F0562_022400 [Nyssa sinensis]|uniref:9-cis-epoxycarotenoid dioxygenase n=1 Tax=Nyssa sinensis TaxID=561372 RepID=A0A5J5BNM9_9ASTE|nr:hypothetical protein F0562_022400 [Nyssa sinensis]